MGARRERIKRALEVGRVARRTRLLRVLREVGVVGDRPATREAAIPFREGLEQLGTTFVKLGQLLSSRPDLLPDVYIEELTHLVDEVPPAAFGDVQRVIAGDVGLEPFAEIDERPLAAASIAQIHAALLKDGRQVVIKVRRPGIEQQVRLDLDSLRRTADFGEGHSETARLIQLRSLAEELEAHLLGELNFVEEANSTGLIAEQLAEYEDLVVPNVIRPLVTERVLVLERIEGEKVSPDHGLDPELAGKLAREFFRAYVRQVTQNGIYHADPHRGNVLLTPTGAWRCSTSGSWGASTTTRAGRSRSCCWRSPRTVPTTWRISSSASR